MDRYPYHWYTILLGATRALAHIGVYFTHHVFGLSKGVQIIHNRIQYSIYIYIQIIHFSIHIFFAGVTGPELAGVTGPVRRAGLIYNLHRKGGPTGECQPPLRCLSQFISYERERDQLLMVL